MTGKLKRDRRFSLRLNKEIFDLLEQEAIKQDISINCLVNHILIKRYKAK